MKTISTTDLDTVTGGADFYGDAKTYSFWAGAAGAASALAKRNAHQSYFNTAGRRGLVMAGAGIAVAGAKWALDKATGQ